MRKVLALLLCLLLLSGPAPVFASSAPGEETTVPEETSDPAPEDPDAPLDALTDVKGDADGDGDVTAADARLILRRAVELERFTEALDALCDFDGDGAVSAADARSALRLAVDLPIGEEEERLRREEEERKRQEEEERKRREEEEERKRQEDLLRQEEEERERIENLRKTREGYMQVLSERVTYGNLSATMETLVNNLSGRVIGSRQHARAEQWIVEKLSSFGFSDIRRRGFYSEDKQIPCVNILGVLPAADPNAPIVLFVAHYDTHATTGGAVDNSSGVSLMLELARILATENRAFPYEIRFLFSDAEELGYEGCYSYIYQVSTGSGTEAQSWTRHLLAFNADMAGCPNYGGPWSIAVSTLCCYYPGQAAINWGSGAVDSAKSLLGDLGEAQYYSPVAAGETDLHPFTKYGLPGVNVSWRTDNPNRSHGSDFDLASWSQIHTWNDNLANFSMDSLYNMTRLVAAAAGNLLF